MEDKIRKIMDESTDYQTGEVDSEIAISKLLDLFSVSKRFEIDFDGNVLAGIEITNNEPKVFGAMNGWGNGISPDKCKITEKTG